MKSAPQTEQDQLWRHFQLCQTEVFDLSYPRLRFFASKCKPGERVLNVGIGNAFLERLLLDRKIAIQTLDPSRMALNRAAKSLGKRFQGKCGYLENIPFPDHSFDRVICTEVLEHLTATQMQAGFIEIRRVLKPRGILNGSVPYRENLRSGMGICPRCSHRFHHWGHQQGGFEQRNMSAWLTRSGFRVLRCYPRTFVDFRRKSLRALLRALGRRLLGLFGEPIVGPSLVFIARSEPSLTQKKHYR